VPQSTVTHYPVSTAFLTVVVLSLSSLSSLLGYSNLFSPLCLLDPRLILSLPLPFESRLFSYSFLLFRLFLSPGPDHQHTRYFLREYLDIEIMVQNHVSAIYDVRSCWVSMDKAHSFFCDQIWSLVPRVYVNRPTPNNAGIIFAEDVDWLGEAKLIEGLCFVRIEEYQNSSKHAEEKDNSREGSEEDGREECREICREHHREHHPCIQ